MYTHLNEKIKPLEKKWKDDLIKLIISKGHQGQGVLIDSIECKIQITSTEISINLEANEYIKYLDDGHLFKGFKEEKIKELKKIVEKEIKKDIMSKLNLKKIKN